MSVTTFVIVAFCVVYAAPLAVCVWVARGVWREIRAEDRAPTIEDMSNVIEFQRSNPRGVGRHDWPL